MFCYQSILLWVSKGGVETATHFSNASLTDDSLNYVCFSADQKNAFNSRERFHMLSSLYSHKSLAALWRIADWAYSTNIPLWVRDSKGNIVYTILSSNGSRQCDPLGMILYALSMRPIFNKTALHSADVHCVAFADDFNIIDPPAAALKAYREFLRLCKADGSIELNKKKKFMYYFHTKPLPNGFLQETEALGFEWVKNKGIILGAPTGFDDHDVEEVTVEIIQKYTPFFERLQHHEMPEVIADQRLRKCGVPCPGYIARTVAPHRTQLSTSISDRWFEEAYVNKHKFTREDWTGNIAMHASLPIGFSGMGLRKHHAIRPFAYWSAAARAVERFTLTDDDNLVHPLNISPTSPYASQLKDIWSTITSAYPETLRPKHNHSHLMPPTGDINTILKYYSKPSNSKIVNDYNAVPHPQIQLTKIYNTHQLRSLIDTSGHVDKARLRSCKGNRSSRWMQPAPIGEMYLDDRVCRTANRLRLGIKKSSKSRSVRCACGEDAKGGEHFFVCTYIKDGPVTLRHNLVKDALINFVQLVNGNTKNLDNKGSFTKSTGERTDIEIFLGSSYYLVDVQVKHPIAKSNSSKAMKALGAATKCEEDKIKKHQEKANKLGAVFVPYVIESFGAFGKEADAFNKIIADFGVHYNSTMPRDELLDFIIYKVAEAIQLGNHMIVEKGFQNALYSDHSSTPDNCYSSYCHSIFQDQSTSPSLHQPLQLPLPPLLPLPPESTPTSTTTSCTFPLTSKNLTTPIVKDGIPIPHLSSSLQKSHQSQLVLSPRQVSIPYPPSAVATSY